MKMSLILLATAALATGACGRDDEADKADVTVDIAADDEGRVELKLPGGFEANVNVPGGISDEAKFDIDGVGLYPGAKVRSVKVNASDRDETHAATVALGFRAPADAAAVADWYQQQFEAKKITASRSGDTLTGKTEDGDDFTLAVAQTDGGSQGTLTIKAVKKG